MRTPRSRGRPPHADVLTPAEWRVVEAVRHGMTNPQIARRQGVSLDAVKYHMANALPKLGLSTRAELRLWDGVRGDSPLKTKRSAVVVVEDVRLGPLAQIARTVADLEAAKAWYGDVLGLELLYAFPGMAFFRLGDVRLYLYRKRLGAPQPGEAPRPVLFMVHGSSNSGRPSFDLEVPGKGEYSLMNVFARWGYDVWTMDHEGYGRS